MSKGVVIGALLFVAADVDVVVVGAAIGEAVDQPRVGVEGEDDRLVRVKRASKSSSLRPCGCSVAAAAS
jgi:hypothetical protein